MNDVVVFPTESRTEPESELTLSAEVFWPAATVYVPANVEPERVSVTEAPVFKVAESVLEDPSVSLKFTVMLMVPPVVKVPAVDVDVTEVTVGPVVSITKVFDAERFVAINRLVVVLPRASVRVPVSDEMLSALAFSPAATV